MIAVCHTRRICDYTSKTLEPWTSVPHNQMAAAESVWGASVEISAVYPV